MESTKTSFPTKHSGATSLPPIGASFMYIETSSGNHGNNVFVSSVQSDIIQKTGLNFYYNRYLILINESIKLMGSFRVQLLLVDKIWNTLYNICKNDRYSNSSTPWTKLSLNFPVDFRCNKLIYDEIDTALADMCFSNNTIPHSLY